MAARSYLSRIAQPLTAADPVVWSTPRAAVDEARPAARAALASQTPSFMPPRAAATPATPAAEFAGDLTTLPPSAAAVEGPPSSALPLAARVQPRSFAPDIATAGDEPTATAVRASAAAPTEAARKSGVRDVSASRDAPPVLDAAEVGPVVVSRRVGSAASRVVDGVAATATAEAATPAPPSQTERRARDVAAPDGVAPPSASVAPPHAGPPAAITAVPEAPRLHIGAIEIRMTPPPAPPPPQTPAPIVMYAPPPVAAPLARGYASRFGLAQG